MKINNHTIELIDDEPPLYNLIHSLELHRIRHIEDLYQK